MCTRYTMATTAEELLEEFEALAGEPGLSLEPSWNVAPTDRGPIVVERRSGERTLSLARFGLVPHWAKDRSVGTRFLNARVETAATTAAFRTAFHRRRCLVAVDGFYEWRREGKAKIPFHFRLPDGGPFALAGLWAVWTGPADEKVWSFSILTAPAEAPVKAIHDRMPLVLPRSAYGEWLDRGNEDGEALGAILAHHRTADLGRFRASPRVNQVRNDGPDLVSAD